MTNQRILTLIKRIRHRSHNNAKIQIIRSGRNRARPLPNISSPAIRRTSPLSMHIMLQTLHRQLTISTHNLYHKIGGLPLPRYYAPYTRIIRHKNRHPNETRSQRIIIL